MDYETELNQIKEEIRKLDGHLLTLQKFAREDLTDIKHYRINEIVRDTMLDGFDFRELIPCDSIKKRLNWAIKNMPGSFGSIQ